MKISEGGGTSPEWSRDGQRLLYETDGRIMAVPFRVQGDSFKPEKAVELLQSPPGIQSLFFREGQDGRFLMIRSAFVPQEGLAFEFQNKVKFVFNWVEELRNGP